MVHFSLFMGRLVPQESGGRASRNQPYSMLSVTGDAVLLEFDTPSSSSTNLTAGAAALNAHASNGALASSSGVSNMGGNSGEGYGQGINLASSSAGFGHYVAASGSSGSINKQAQMHAGEYLHPDPDSVA